MVSINVTFHLGLQFNSKPTAVTYVPLGFAVRSYERKYGISKKNGVTKAH